MVKTGPGVTWRLGDIETWQPDRPVDLIFANASLHWIGDHDRLLPRLVAALTAAGTLAVQMPLSWDQPSHHILRRVGLEFGVDFAAPPTLEPGDYLDLLAGHTDARVWVTTYYHVLGGDNPVYAWVSATGMKRFLDRLDPADHGQFSRQCAAGMAAAYPANARGETTFPFTRLFVLAGRRR